jgi:sortase (surface protein transpeptidase)
MSLRIPSLGVDAPVTGVGLDKNRQLETPPVDQPKLVGWYRGGATPGESGTAIAVGHRDTRTGPAVFAALAQVKPGKRIEARRADGRTAIYTVDRVKVFDKNSFPDKEVYGATRRPVLRVITCGGLFSLRSGYTSNVVVFAHLTATREPAHPPKPKPKPMPTPTPTPTPSDRPAPSPPFTPPVPPPQARPTVPQSPPPPPPPPSPQPVGPPPPTPLTSPGVGEVNPVFPPP